MTIDISKLEKFLISKLEDEVESEWSDYSFEKNGPGTADRIIRPVLILPDVKNARPLSGIKEKY